MTAQMRPAARDPWAGRDLLGPVPSPFPVTPQPQVRPWLVAWLYRGRHRG